MLKFCFDSTLVLLLWWDVRGRNIEPTLVPKNCFTLVCKLGQESTQPQNICDIVLEKAMSDEWFSRSSRWSFIKKVFWEISKNSQESTCARVSFLTKLDVVDLQLHLKRAHESSSTGSFYEFYSICKELFFPQNSIGWLLLIIAG